AHLVHRVHRRVAVQEPPRAALLVEVCEVRVDHGADARAARPRRSRLRLQLLEKPRAGALHARLVEALLGAEVLVEERLRDPARLRDLVHRRRTEAVLAEDSLAGVEHPLLALAAR